MPKLSVIIITFNEERNIGRCLKSIQEIADEVVVVDSFSTDATPAICSQFEHVKFVQQEWKGYSATKNYANALASNDWILSLDADEAPSATLLESIKKMKTGNELSTCSFNRMTNYCGTWIRHSAWYPDVKIRIFDRRYTQWTGSIHEQLEIYPQPKIIHLKGDLLHYSYYTIAEHYKQADKFSSLAAQHLFEKKKRTNSVQVVLKPLAKFLRNYFIKLGILDGRSGFTVCRIAAYETYLKYYKLLQLQRKNP